jgi:hypothetical protein
VVKKLLKFIAQYVGFLYLNPEYRITDSSSRGLGDIDASSLSLANSSNGMSSMTAGSSTSLQCRHFRCEELIALENALADKYFGPSKT